MAKKRQHDFARVQLRPGRIIGKRGNITSTKFKSRKIIMPKEKAIKVKSELTLVDYINRIKTPGSDKDKSKHLYDMNKLIHRQPDTANAHLLNIFNSVFVFIKDPNDNVREEALKVLKSIIELTNDLHLHHCSDIICRNITAIMKNPNQRIASISLILLDSMLKHHPALICHNTNILDDLLPTYRKHYTRKMISNEREKLLYSENDEINSLGHISAFLKNILLLKNKNDLAKNEEDDKVVHMDEKLTMSVVLYAGGGLQPVDIEQAYAAEFNPQVDPFHEVEKLTPCIDALLKYIPIYFCQVINKESSADDNAFRSEPISNLCVIIQLLCNVAELAEKLDYSNAAEEIAAFLKEKVFSSHKKRFPFELHTAITDTARQPVAVLNASLCYLQMKFLSSDDSYDDDGKLIKRYLKKFFSAEKVITPDVKYQCVPYFIKMIQLCEYKTDVPNVIPVLLKNLVNLLKTARGNPSNKKILIKFLLDMSLLPGYKFWIETPPMKLWYEWLINHLKDTTKLDKETMQMICKIAKLRHSSFIELLDFSILKPLLTKRNNDLRETAVFLLHNMDIDNELLKNVYDVICLDSFPKKFAVALIRMLNVRFNQYPANKRPYVDYIEFLLNIAIDVSSFSKSRMIDVEANSYTKAVQLIQHGHPFCIVPFLHWRDHSKFI